MQQRSKNRNERRTTASSPTTTQDDKPSKKRLRGRAINVYDAVAGKKPHHPKPPSISESWKTATDSKSSEPPRVLAPEDVLFRRKHAPTRYAEADLYWEAYDELKEGQLPESELLGGIHAYASRFYAALGARVARRERRKSGVGPGLRGSVFSALVDEKSIDGTGLLALGILLEEAAREAVRETGAARVLVEGREVRRSADRDKDGGGGGDGLGGGGGEGAGMGGDGDGDLRVGGGGGEDDTQDGTQEREAKRRRIEAGGPVDERGRGAPRISVPLRTVRY
ncbi:hypothetical protein QBC47DRAFT_393732 [Echria macrotheca]|uniref:Uncharacterized protein n=1 Tax=Echria macrotheca TaxID=438768 RepID=A0AAJ0B2N6_9PEZI|nr:hypothetical protein QBC47DRAFT_393732 [Echria macrotheca]